MAGGTAWEEEKRSRREEVPSTRSIRIEGRSVNRLDVSDNLSLESSQSWSLRPGTDLFAVPFRLGSASFSTRHVQWSSSSTALPETTLSLVFTYQSHERSTFSRCTTFSSKDPTSPTPSSLRTPSLRSSSPRRPSSPSRPPVLALDRSSCSRTSFISSLSKQGCQDHASSSEAYGCYRVGRQGEGGSCESEVASSRFVDGQGLPSSFEEDLSGSGRAIVVGREREGTT